MAKRVKVLFVVPGLYHGGAETQLINMLNGLCTDTFETHLISFEQQHNLLPNIDKTRTKYQFFPRKKYYDRSLSKRISAYIDLHKIEVVHATLFIGGFFADLAIRQAKTRCPLIIAIHSSQIQTLKGQLIVRCVFRRSLRTAAALVFVSNNQKALWTNKFPWINKSAITIHNGIDEKRFIAQEHKDAGSKFRQKYSIDDAMPVISCIAAFRPEKNHKLLIEAIRNIDQGFTLCLAGDGAGQREIERMVNAYGLTNKVKFLGRQVDIRPLLAITAFTVLSSNSEAFSMAMLESLAMQVPMLATNVGGLNEAIIPGQTGLLVKPLDVNELKKGIISMLSNPAKLKTMGTNGATLIRNKFTQSNMIDQTTQTILNLVHQRS